MARNMSFHMRSVNRVIAELLQNCCRIATAKKQTLLCVPIVLDCALFAILSLAALEGQLDKLLSRLDASLKGLAKARRPDC